MTDLTATPTVRIGLNDQVRVRLTEKGLAMMEASHAADFEATRGKVGPWRAPETDEDGWSRHTLWEVMHVLAPAFGNGLDNAMEIEFLVERDPGAENR